MLRQFWLTRSDIVLSGQALEDFHDLIRSVGTGSPVHPVRFLIIEEDPTAGGYLFVGAVGDHFDLIPPNRPDPKRSGRSSNPPWPTALYLHL